MSVCEGYVTKDCSIGVLIDSNISAILINKIKTQFDVINLIQG